MKLIVVHQILIASAIGLAAVFAIRAIVVFARTGVGADLGFGVAAVLVAGALAFYLRKVRAKVAQGRRSMPAS